MHKLSFQIGLTPLHIAADKGHADFVRVLVTKYNAIIDPFTVVSFLSRFLHFFSLLEHCELNSTENETEGPLQNGVT